jgi:hypothetical protein
MYLKQLKIRFLLRFSNQLITCYTWLVMPLLEFDNQITHIAEARIKYNT